MLDQSKYYYVQLCAIDEAYVIELSDLEKKIYFEILQTVGRKIPDSTWALFKKQYQSLYPVEKGHNAFTIIICKYMVQMWSE